jgi:hypothetical protein
MKNGGMNDNTIHDELVMVSTVLSLRICLILIGLDIRNGMSFEI